MTNPSNRGHPGGKIAKSAASAATALAIALMMQAATPDPASAGERVRCSTTSYGTHCHKGVQVKFKCKMPVKKWVKLASGANVLRTVVKLQTCVRTSEKKCFTSKRYSRCKPK